MHSHFLRRIKRRLALAMSIALLGTAGVLVGVSGGPFGASACACESEAGKTVTIREKSTTGSAVPAGTTLVGKSSNFVIHMTAGNVECANSTIEGPLEVNGKVSNTLNAKTVTASECTTTFAGKPTATVTTNAPWTVEVQWWSLFEDAWWRPFWPAHLTNLAYTVALSSGPKCVYGFTEMKGISPSAGPPLVAKFTNQKVTKESGESPCEEKAELSAEYKIKTAGGTELAVTTP